MRKNDLRTFLVGAAGALTTLLLFVAVQSIADPADNNPATDNLDRVIPYDGVLELDGSALSGDIDMRFSFYDEDDNPLDWIETYSADGDSGSQVSVYSGRFSVILGQYVDLTNSVFDAEPLYLGIDVRNAAACDPSCTDEDWVILSGRQLIGMTPFAMWATQSSDMHVANTLTVDGNVGIGASANNARLVIQRTQSADDFDEDRDYQIMLHDGDTPQESYGMGIRSGTMAFNSNSEYDFDVQGVTRLNLTDSSMTVDGNVGIGASPNDARLLLQRTQSADDFDEDGDYVIMLHDGNTPQTSYGMGIRSNTMAFNSNSHYDFDVQGVTKLNVTSSNVTTTDDLAVGGDLTVGGNFADFHRTSEYSASRSGSSGTTTETMVILAKSFCFLTYVAIEETDTNGEYARCQIHHDGTRWTLNAVLAMSSDTAVSCKARCFSWGG